MDDKVKRRCTVCGKTFPTVPEMVEHREEAHSVDARRVAARVARRDGDQEHRAQVVGAVFCVGLAAVALLWGWAENQSEDEKVTPVQAAISCQVELDFELGGPYTHEDARVVETRQADRYTVVRAWYSDDGGQIVNWYVCTVNSDRDVVSIEPADPPG